MRVTAERLRENLSEQNALVAARIDAAGRLSGTIAQALEAAQGLSDLSETLVSNAAAGTTAVISNLYELVESEDRIEESLEALDRLYEEDIFLNGTRRWPKRCASSRSWGWSSASSSGSASERKRSSGGTRASSRCWWRSAPRSSPMPTRG